MPLLYVDLLGVKAQYKSGGAKAAKKQYEILEELVVEGLKHLPKGVKVRGGVQSDAAAIVVDEPKHAIEVGRALFSEALKKSETTDRIWIRGVIVKCDDTGPLETVSQLVGAPHGFRRRYLASSMLDAIAAEQSGFKGQRLLIQSSLAKNSMKRQLGTQLKRGMVFPCHKLQHSATPEGYEDVFWPIPPNIDDWKSQYIRMTDRARWAQAGGEGEASQAFATLLLFSEIDSIIHNLGGPSAIKVEPRVQTGSFKPRSHQNDLYQVPDQPTASARAKRPSRKKSSKVSGSAD